MTPQTAIRAAGPESPAKVRPPLAREVVHNVAVEHGVCVRPIAMRRTDLETGESEIVSLSCGHTLASVCPSCAEAKRRLRADQCRAGWHLDQEPVIERADPDEIQRWWMEKRAEAVRLLGEAVRAGDDPLEFEHLIAEIDMEIEACGVAGKLPGKTKPAKRARSTRRRQDAPELPRRPVDKRTTGKVYEGKEGKTFRPSIFLTLTLDTYGKVRADGTPVDTSTYDYARAARDAIHFPKLIDRFVQNLRRYAGYDVQYFAAIEPQRRLAPHVHMAIRGTISRKDLRRVAAATYHQVWWPACDQVLFDGDHLPRWEPGVGQPGSYIDPVTGECLPTWDEALAQLDQDDDAEPLHVVRFGSQLDAQGVIAGSPESDKLLGYLTKYLVKNVAECHEPETAAQTDHVERLAEELRYEPCSPTCANWLRFGIQPKGARPGLAPGYCKGKAHRREHLGQGGRRVLVSRKWSGKTLTDHRNDRKNWVLARLAQAGADVSATHISADDKHRYAWEKAPPDDPDVAPVTYRLLHLIAERIQRRRQLDHANTQHKLSATGRSA